MLRLTLILAFAGLIAAQVPVMPSSSMNILGSRGATAHIDFILDFQCPDSKQAWPTIKQLATMYGEDKLSVRLVAFPLPYHHQAFFAAQSARVATELNGTASAYVAMGDCLFDTQEQWGDVGLQNTTPMDALSNFFAPLANHCVGVDENSFITAMGWTTEQNIITRSEWKEAAAMGAYGTPMFWVNGAQISLDGTASVSDWKAVLDPLMQ
eukprot:m.15495 g.15495  ORF g.15495 m.15495 type:complete len:210 (+) comp10474_c0_seq1:104-733(+)